MAPTETLQVGSKEFEEVKDKMVSTIKTHKGNRGGVFTDYKIYYIKKIKNDPLLKRFESKQSKISQTGLSTEKLLFHGTLERNLGKILNDGFSDALAGPNVMFGPGIYFAEHSSKSNQYTFDRNGCRRHKNEKCDKCFRYLLLCRVELGNTHKATQIVNIKNLPNTHSISAQPKARFLEYPEYVISDVEQAYPEYLIKYIIKA